MNSKSEELQVIVKAKALAKHTMQLTSNANRYPKKYRFSLVDKMQNKCLDIYTSLLEANRTDIKDYKRERLELQTKELHAIKLEIQHRKDMSESSINRDAS